MSYGVLKFASTPRQLLFSDEDGKEHLGQRTNLDTSGPSGSRVLFPSVA